MEVTLRAKGACGVRFIGVAGCHSWSPSPDGGAPSSRDWARAPEARVLAGVQEFFPRRLGNTVCQGGVRRSRTDGGTTSPSGYLPEPPLPFILTAAALTTASSDRCSVAQLWLTLCKSTDCSTSGFPVLHQLPEVYSNSCPLSPWMAPPITLCLGQPPRQIFF